MSKGDILGGRPKMVVGGRLGGRLYERVQDV